MCDRFTDAISLDTSRSQSSEQCFAHQGHNTQQRWGESLCGWWPQDTCGQAVALSLICHPDWDVLSKCNKALIREDPPCCFRKRVEAVEAALGNKGLGGKQVSNMPAYTGISGARQAAFLTPPGVCTVYSPKQAVFYFVMLMWNAKQNKSKKVLSGIIMGRFWNPVQLKSPHSPIRASERQANQIMPASSWVVDSSFWRRERKLYGFTPQRISMEDKRASPWPVTILLFMWSWSISSIYSLLSTVTFSVIKKSKSTSLLMSVVKKGFKRKLDKLFRKYTFHSILLSYIYLEK